MKQILKKIWTDKGILFLVLMAIYMVPAFFLNGYYKQVILAGGLYLNDLFLHTYALVR